MQKSASNNTFAIKDALKKLLQKNNPIVLELLGL